MIEPSDISPLISLGCAKGSQHGVESLAGEVRGGAPLKTAARDLKPDADDDIGRQLHVLYGQSSLGDRLGKVRLEIFANAGRAPAGTWALRTTSRPQRGSSMAFSRNFVKAKDMRTMGSGFIEPGWCQELVKAIGEASHLPRRPAPRRSGNDSRTSPWRRLPPPRWRPP